MPEPALALGSAAHFQHQRLGCARPPQIHQKEVWNVLRIDVTDRSPLALLPQPARKARKSLPWLRITMLCGEDTAAASPDLVPATWPSCCTHTNANGLSNSACRGRRCRAYPKRIGTGPRALE